MTFPNTVRTLSGRRLEQALVPRGKPMLNLFCAANIVAARLHKCLQMRGPITWLHPSGAQIPVSDFSSQETTAGHWKGAVTADSSVAHRPMLNQAANLQV